MEAVEGGANVFKPLLGTDEATIDDKGRILVSKKKRERLGETFAIVRGPLGCLEAYPQSVWEAKVKQIMGYDSLNPASQQFSRLILGEAEDELKFDQQGRVVIPQKLRGLAKLVDKVLLVGCGDRLEIWSAIEWAKYEEFPDHYGKDRKDAVVKAYDNMVPR